MLHEFLKDYLDAVEQAILSCDGVYVERYTEEILTRSTLTYVFGYDLIKAICWKYMRR